MGLPKVALVYPPTTDPTAPYLSLPTLTAYLRAHGVDVLQVDANVEAWGDLLAPGPLRALGRRVAARLRALDARPTLGHADALLYAALFGALGDAAAVPRAIDGALATLRGHDMAAFLDARRYGDAVATVEAAQRLVSAAYAPLAVDFVSYRTPFSLLDLGEIEGDAAPDRDPFHATFARLAGALVEAGVGLVGISVAFPGQLQPAYSLAHALRRAAPSLHVTVGGPAITQVLLRFAAAEREALLGPFSSAVLFEGEAALLDFVRALGEGRDPCAGGRVVRGSFTRALSELPPPDFDGLPLERYLAPELVLPYDPTRGCYWGACTFCHYGLAEHGTAAYRERGARLVVDHLAALSARFGARTFYFSQDVLSPRLASQIAAEVARRGLDLRWASDMRPERALTRARAAELRAGGALGFALGIESAAPRVLALIDKGVDVPAMRAAVTNLAEAGLAAEAMCFTDFPTERAAEAHATLDLVGELEDRLSLFICGEFDLTHGSLVAERPADFGIAERWHVEGDALRTGLFYREARASKRPAERAAIEARIARLAARWHLRRYPWAGALSTAHTLLYYRHAGPDVFRRLAGAPSGDVPYARARTVAARFDVAALARTSAAREAALWRRLVEDERRVGRGPYEALARALPRVRPRPLRWRVRAGGAPTLVEPARARGRRRPERRATPAGGSGRRPRTGPNARRR